MHFSASSRTAAGFTLVEIIISIAIMGIITSIVFGGLRNEQQRSAAKDAAERLQVELSGLQNSAQSAIALATRFCTRTGSYPGQGNSCTADNDCLVNNIQGHCVQGPPQAYGLSVRRNASTYDLFGDMPFGTTPVDGQRVVGAGSNDVATVSAKPLGTNIIASSLLVNNQPVDRIDITFSGSEGKMLIYQQGIVDGCKVETKDCLLARIVLQNTTTGVCYRLVADATSGLITKRQYSSACD